MRDNLTLAKVLTTVSAKNGKKYNADDLDGFRDLIDQHYELKEFLPYPISVVSEFAHGYDLIPA